MKAPIVKDNMTKALVTVSWSDAMTKAHKIMEERRIRHLPVIDREGFVVGILSDRDVFRAMSPGRPGFASDIVVGDYMSWPAITVDEKSSVKDITEGMIDEKVSAFLVTRDGKQVVGIVTSEDLLRYLHSLLDGKGEQRVGLDAIKYTPIVQEVMREMSAAGI